MPPLAMEMIRRVDSNFDPLKIWPKSTSGENKRFIFGSFKDENGRKLPPTRPSWMNCRTSSGRRTFIMEDSHTTPISKVLWPVHISASLKRRATLVMLQDLIEALDQRPHLCNSYLFKLEVDLVEGLARSIFADRVFMGNLSTEANEATTKYSRKYLSTLAKKIDVNAGDSRAGWGAGVSVGGSKGPGDIDDVYAHVSMSGAVAGISEKGDYETFMPVVKSATEDWEDIFLRNVMTMPSEVAVLKPVLAKICDGILHILQNSQLRRFSSYEKWTVVRNSISGNLRNAQEKVGSMQFGGPGVMKNILGILKRTSKIVLSVVLFGNTPVIGAIAPEAGPAHGTLQAGNSDSNSSSNFAFGLVASIGVLFTIIGVLITIKWRKRQPKSIAVSATDGENFNRAGTRTLQTHTVQRYWSRTEYNCVEVVVAHHEEGV